MLQAIRLGLIVNDGRIEPQGTRHPAGNYASDSPAARHPDVSVSFRSGLTKGTRDAVS